MLPEESRLLAHMTEEQRLMTLTVRRLTAKWIEEHFGERCKDFSADCAICQRWDAFDELWDGAEPPMTCD